MCGVRTFRPDGLSYLHYDDDDEYGGDDEIITHGYAQLFGGGQLDASRLDIALGAHVTNIESLREGKVRVATKDGATHEADICIVTLPLAVLKREVAADGASALFTPPLPPWKVDSIRKLGVSLLNKVMLRFDTVWWWVQPPILRATARRCSRALPMGATSRVVLYIYAVCNCHAPPSVHVRVRARARVRACAC